MARINTELQNASLADAVLTRAAQQLRAPRLPRVPADIASALTTLAVTCIAAAVAVGVLSLLEAALPRMHPALDERTKPEPRPKPWRVGVQRPTTLATACVLTEPARCETD